MARMTQDTNQIRNYLTGVRFPAKKDDIVRAARDQNAPDHILQALKNLPDREFRQVNEVTEMVQQR
jgi:hypothetical protein